MGNIKRFLSSILYVAVMLGIFAGWSKYRQHQAKRLIQLQIELKQAATPKGGPVGNLQEGIRWQD